LVLERPEHPVSRRDIDPNVLKVLYRLINAGHVAYLVGGGVRDLMLGRRPKDFDIATSAHPHQVRELFRNSRLIGRRFRLVHVFFGPVNIEVATFRCRGENDDVNDLLIRHDNTFGTPEQDAARRDFTVNALFYDPSTFRVIDYVGGIPDLSERLIRTVGDPELRMREDPVRMIRAVRLAAKLDFEIEPATAWAIERWASDLTRASPPRLVEEIYRTLLLANSSRALFLMERRGLLNSVLPMLSCHLKPHQHALEAAPTIRIMGALGDAIKAGFEPSRGFLLACLFADLHLGRGNESSLAHLLRQSNTLRARGFSRADTEHFRMLLEAVGHLANPSRITRRLVRRPYYPFARKIYELVAPIFPIDVTELDRFLATPAEHYRTYKSQHITHATGERPRRRKRRRGGRQRSRGLETASAARAEAPNAVGAEKLGAEPPVHESTRPEKIAKS